MIRKEVTMKSEKITKVLSVISDAFYYSLTVIFLIGIGILALPFLLLDSILAIRNKIRYGTFEGIIIGNKNYID